MYMCDPPQNIPLPPSQNTPPFSTTKCDIPRIYPTFNNYNIMRCSQNLPLPPRIYPPPFQQLYMTLPETITPSQNIPTFQQLYYYTTLPESIPPSISPRIYPPPLSTTIYDTHRNYPSLGEHPPPFYTTICPLPSQNISLLTFLQLYAIFQEHSPQSLIMPPFLEAFVIVRESTTCSQNWKKILGGRGRFWEGRIIL